MFLTSGQAGQILGGSRSLAMNKRWLATLGNITDQVVILCGSRALGGWDDWDF
jgi:hypothetical protein